MVSGSNADDIEIDLPSNQFNHVILQVPLPDNLVWLEFTSNLLSAGYLGDFTKNRHVLVTNSDGGYLTKTPDYFDPAWNQISTTNNIQIDENGNASISTHQSLIGNFAEEVLYVKQEWIPGSKRNFFIKTPRSPD